jgi:hypothetical protein
MNKTIIKQVKNDKGVIFNAKIYKDKKGMIGLLPFLTQDIKKVLANLVKVYQVII